MLKNLILQEQPQIIFMQETKCSTSTLEPILSRVWTGCQTAIVDAIGASGGLAIAWNSHHISLTNIHASRYFIQAMFHLISTNIHSHLTNVYFPHESTQKIKQLETLQILNAPRAYPLWITGGDFNMITQLEEKMGGRRKLDKESNEFKAYIQYNNLMDPPFDNGIFTWNNKKEGTQQIASRLDRFQLSHNFFHLGGDISTSILPLVGSDHWPNSLQWKNPGNSNRKPFKFESFWLTHPEFNTMVKAAWESFIPIEGSLMYQFQQRLKHIKNQIKL